MALRTLTDATSTTSQAAKVAQGVKHSRKSVVEVVKNKSPRSKAGVEELVLTTAEKAAKRATVGSQPARVKRPIVLEEVTPVRKQRPVQVEEKVIPTKVRTPRTPRGVDVEDNAVKLELTRAARKALGLQRGEHLTKLTKAQRKIVEEVDSKVSTRTSRTTEKGSDDVKSLKAQVRELQRELNAANKKLDRVTSIVNA